jgi:hypothetical protein
MDPYQEIHQGLLCMLWSTNVYLNLTKFKMESLVLAGFLVGAHPGYL